MSDAKLYLKSYLPDTDTHHHSFHQLVLPVAGSLSLEIGHRAGEVNAQQAAVICANQNHAFEGLGENQFIVANIPIALAPAFAELPAFIQLDDNLKRYLGFLQGQLTPNSSAKHSLLERQMILLLVQLLDDSHSAKPQYDKRIETARAYLEKYFFHRQALREAANHAGISMRHLRTLFSKYYSLAPSQYLLELRMQAAWQLLQHSSLSVQLVAERCGYSSMSAFSDRFHRHFAQSASQVRRLSK